MESTGGAEEAKGRKSWNPPGAQKRLRAASLGIERPLPWEALAIGRWVEVSNVFGSFFSKFTPKI